MNDIKKEQRVSAEENKQIVESLYRYLRDLDLGIPWHFEFLPEENPALSIKQLSGAVKTRINVIGGYEAELPFVVYHKSIVTSTRSALSLTEPLNHLAKKFDEETKNGFPNLKLDGFEPLSLEMTATPTDDFGIENNVAIFNAYYKLKYKYRRIL